MSASTIVARRSASLDAVSRLIARRPVAAYLIMAFVLAWTSMLPLLLSRRGLDLLPIDLPVLPFQVLASFLGLALPAFLVAAATGGKAGALDLLRRSLRWRVGLRWYLVALLVIFVGTLLVAIPFQGLAPLQALARRWDLLFLVFLPGVLVPFLHTNLPEEIGWTSLQARLQERYGPMRASMIVMTPMALIHTPAYLVAGWISDEKAPLSALPEILLSVGVLAVVGIVFRIVIMWLYNGTGGSIFIAGLFHAAFNMSTGPEITPALVPGVPAAMPATGAVVVVALLVAVITRGHLGRSLVRPSRRGETLGRKAPSGAR